MTPQEAAQHIKKHNERHSKRERFAVYITEALSMAIAALEKQTPKKGALKYLSSYTDDPPVMVCPNCQEHIPTEGCNFYKYCYNCGQALNWKEDATDDQGSTEKLPTTEE